MKKFLVILIMIMLVVLHSLGAGWPDKPAGGDCKFSPRVAWECTLKECLFKNHPRFFI